MPPHLLARRALSGGGRDTWRVQKDRTEGRRLGHFVDVHKIIWNMAIPRKWRLSVRFGAIAVRQSPQCRDG